MTSHITHKEHARKNAESVKPQNTADTQNLENTDVRNVVSEITSETASEQSGVSSQTAAQVASAAQRAAFEERKKELIAAKPPVEQMVGDISATLEKENRSLKTEERKYRMTGDMHHLAKVVARLREIREIFSTIAHATYDILKKIWLKVVHGIV